jgi:phosphatidylglycerophosphatase A
MTAARVDGAFLLAHPAHFIALGFGSGLAPFAPGTFGTLLAIPIALALHRYGNDAAFVAAIALAGVAGAWSAGVTGRHLGRADHGAIVIDEIAAFLLVLFFTGTEPPRIAVAFGLFRLFDIVKPPPIRQVDAAMKNATGVMVDDLIAAFYTLLALALGKRLFGA